MWLDTTPKKRYQKNTCLKELELITILGLKVNIIMERGGGEDLYNHLMNTSRPFMFIMNKILIGALEL